jgi:hypothetical protein
MRGVASEIGAVDGVSNGSEEYDVSDPTPTEQAIEQNAQGPKKAQGDAGSVEQHSLPDQIAADRYLASKRAVRLRGKGIVISKIIPPGAA